MKQNYVQYYHRVPTLLLNQKTQDFSRTFQDPHEKFSRTFLEPANSATSKIWMLAVQNSDELIYIWSLYTCRDCRSSLEVFHFSEPLEKCMTFEDIFPGLSRTLSFNFQDFPKPKVIFQDFPGPGIFKEKIQDFPGGMGTLYQLS